MIQDQLTIKNDRLYIAFELSNSKWKILFSNGFKRRQRTIDARDMVTLAAEIEKAKHHFKMGDDVTVHSCYEAGRDGFWIHRQLEDEGVKSFVVDSASIEVNRRFRRVKTDRVDVAKLMNMLIRYLNGESKVWSVIRVPSIEEEDNRRLNREIERLKSERTGHTNRIKSLLVLHGIVLKIGRHFLTALDKATMPNGDCLPPFAKKEILREHKRYELVQAQLGELREKQKAILSESNSSAEKVKTLQSLKGVGPVSSWNLVYEFFWRQFKNGKEVGAAAGLTPTPYASGGPGYEQGISKSGNKRVRWLMVELSWSWLRYQPNSKLSLWFEERYGSGNKRMRRVGIVALARRLLVALWRYLEYGVVPEGAEVKMPS
jgi:transposase